MLRHAKLRELAGHSGVNASFIDCLLHNFLHKVQTSLLQEEYATHAADAKDNRARRRRAPTPLSSLPRGFFREARERRASNAPSSIEEVPAWLFACGDITEDEVAVIAATIDGAPMCTHAVLDRPLPPAAPPCRGSSENV